MRDVIHVAAKINSKSETRNSKQIRITKIQMIKTDFEILVTTEELVWLLEHSDLGFVSDFDIRYSNFNSEQ